jgi:hypothetical protein
VKRRRRKKISCIVDGNSIVYEEYLHDLSSFGTDFPDIHLNSHRTTRWSPELRSIDNISRVLSSGI